MSVEKIEAAIKIECDRQGVGKDRRRRLLATYLYLQNTREVAVLTERMITRMAVEIEPYNFGEYRSVPVTFRSITGGVVPDNVPRAMQNWIEWFNQGIIHQQLYKARWDECNRIIKEFLDIHPFSDGNGRLAWLLRVWMLNQWDDPQPLPDYYGGQK